MELVHWLMDLFLHLDVHLNDFSTSLGAWLYLVLFAIIFCETGLVVTPILPGDSLLFAVGALAAIDQSPLSMPLLIVSLIVAAVVGDAVNYAIGLRLGPRVFSSERSWLFNKKHLIETQRFYEEYGSITIIVARFMPIIRTFAPFVAGIGKMAYARFFFYNVTGAICWVTAFLLGGYYLGNVPAVKRNFQFVIIGILIVSVLPAVFKFLLARRKGPPSGGAGDVVDQPVGATQQ
jgi:membrane-associated protein